MNVVFVSTEFVVKNRPSTGLPNYLYRVAKALLARGHRPIVITCGECDEHVMYDGIEVYRKTVGCNFCKNEIIDYLLFCLYNSYVLNKIVRRVCAENRIDIIQYTSLGGIALFYSVKVPAVIRLSSYARISYNTNVSFSGSYIACMAFVERIVAKRMKGIFSPSIIMAKGYSKDIRKKVAVIETVFENEEEQADYSKYDLLLKERKYILYFGALYAEKGVFVIGEILQQILQENLDYYFVFVGNAKIINGRDPIKELKEKAGKYIDRVIFINAVTHDKLYPIILNAEFVVLPSFMENLSNACIEAMSLGKIVIGTDGASYEQLITDGENGFLALPRDVETLYQSINRALQLSQKEKCRMEDNAKKRIQKLSPEYIIPKLLRYYKYIINQ